MIALAETQREDEKEPRAAIAIALAAGAYSTQGFANAINWHHMMQLVPLGSIPLHYVFQQQGFGGAQYLSKYLQDLALAAFDTFALQDASSISRWLAGNVKPSVPGYDYGTVAEDLLAVLARQGLIEKDEHGWYRRVGKP